MKKEIVNQSIQLFLQYGFKSITMDDIAKHMGVSKKTIYVHFPTKDELVEQSVLNHFDEIIKNINVISKQSKDPIIELYQIKKEALSHLSGEKNSPQYQLQKDSAQRQTPHISATTSNSISKKNKNTRH